MRTFYGTTPTTGSTPAPSVDLLTLAQQAAPVISAFVMPSDPVQRAAVLEARIKNLQSMREKFPVAATLYTNEIRKLKATLAATKNAVALQAEQDSSRRVFRYLGWVGGSIAILFGIALTARTLRRR